MILNPGIIIALYGLLIAGIMRFYGMRTLCKICVFITLVASAIGVITLKDFCIDIGQLVSFSEKFVNCGFLLIVTGLVVNMIIIRFAAKENAEELICLVVVDSIFVLVFSFTMMFNSYNLALKDIVIVKPGDHARKSAISRTYETLVR